VELKAQRPQRDSSRIDSTTSAAERLARLREESRGRSRLPSLLEEYAPTKAKRSASRRAVWLLVAGGVGIAGVGFFLVSSLLGGGSSSKPTASTPAPSSPPAQVTALVGAPTARPARAASATADASQTSDTSAPGGVPEGAVDASVLGRTPPNGAPIFLLPASGFVQVTDPFGSPRGPGYVHAGADLVARSGGPLTVVSSCSGRVVGISNQAGFGDFVVVDCGNGWRAVYAAMEKITARATDDVSAGVSALGTTAKLHFEIRYNGVPVDPATYVNFAGLPGTPVPETPTPAATASPTKTASPIATPRADAGGPTSGPTVDTPATAAPTVATPPTPTSTPEPAKPTNTPKPTPTRRPPTPTPAPVGGIR
jgi:murein DD-endopeptidase MepM/ murein hydrolase activator NlpD